MAFLSFRTVLLCVGMCDPKPQEIKHQNTKTHQNHNLKKPKGSEVNPRAPCHESLSCARTGKKPSSQEVSPERFLYVASTTNAEATKTPLLYLRVPRGFHLRHHLWNIPCVHGTQSCAHSQAGKGGSRCHTHLC